MKNWVACFLFFLLSSLLFGQETAVRTHTATSNVSIIEKVFVIPELNSISHKIWVYLPPDYVTSSKKYPVIYMHDAQNLFDAATSYSGEWEVDESLNKLFNKTGKGFIVVAVENGGDERINEYTPWLHKKYGGGKGDLYINFIVNTLKPYIDATYRTKPQQKFTGLIGSSLGGLISYYGGLKYPKVFGKIGALSTSFWFSNEVVIFTNKKGNLNKVKLILLVGEKEGEDVVLDTKNIEKQLLETGFKSKNLKTKVNPEGQHNEAFWKSEFSEIVQWLYNIQ
ncbi:Predicted hydrolase of the alpha/beta superfamily [Lutibacter agarilyticus]|uniref:Predicted hydrolase of the alpha/beta superfamily n=1 Tax=Lutibacter agarilyticus TaxID=1109740 RepID=A0A238W2I7_9FLAO|nr:alpha/beta hydrolase-fold protein [Lutibacter agarilyticus]SNR40780.1 Predicted hydrolase of the alpha/beta superfamily [Lutibacter agarilyticus]